MPIKHTGLILLLIAFTGCASPCRNESQRQLVAQISGLNTGLALCEYEINKREKKCDLNRFGEAGKKAREDTNRQYCLIPKYCIQYTEFSLIAECISSNAHCDK